jgi:HK97 family phage major capsid protein
MEAAAVSSDGLIDLLYKLKAKYRKNAVWVMNSNTAATLQKLKNGNGDYIWRDRLVAGSPDTLLGRPVQYLETMPDAAAGEAFLAVGDFKRGYFIVDHTTGVRTRPDNITEPVSTRCIPINTWAAAWWTPTPSRCLSFPAPVPDLTFKGLRPLFALCGVQ